jgi:site-specific recombinase XerD
MKPTDFSKTLEDFLTKYLPGERGMSHHTIASYKDTFILLIHFFDSRQGVPPHKLTLSMMDKNSIIKFLDWLQQNRNCCDATRNVRLSGLHSFFKYLQYRNPENMHRWQDVLSIREKKTSSNTVNYLSAECIKLLLEKPDRHTWRGRRDVALLSLIYDCGARVQEIIDLTAGSVRCECPYTLKIVGKGNKARIVPLMADQYRILNNYMQENSLLQPHMNQHPLFFNSRKEKLTRAGVNYILEKYLDLVREDKTIRVPDGISCHSLRHSKAMHLLEAGVNIVYIRDLLGHQSVTTTEIYARADSKQKREALEKASINIISKEQPKWLMNNDLLQWLKNL